MEIRYVTYAETLELFRQPIALKGEDYVYERNDSDDDTLVCYYAKNGEPSCIVGHVLHALGVSIEDMTHGYRRGPLSEGFIGENLLKLTELYGLQFDTQSTVFMSRIQRHQDNEEPWGEAYSAAKEYADSYTTDSSYMRTI